MSSFDYRNQFQNNVQQYENITDTKHINLIYNLERHVLLKMFSRINSKDKALMDFACGTGRWTHVLENYFADSIGVDVSEEMVSVAQKKCKKTKFIITDITSVNDEKLDGFQFDIITAFRFFKNAQDQLRQDVISSIGKYLKKNGYFVFDLHLNSYSFMGILANVISFLELNKRLGISKLATKTISIRQVRKLFKDSDFEIVDYYGMGLLPGRSNFTILPNKVLSKVETFFTEKKILRNYSYNILVVAKKK
ncbi:MAG: hypothetical protein DRP56_02875 [Planctomycetota bacterium]|nr:MAG: hypothetical protein DRP56_02875 [Planctomycetota bacterium]